ncbi:MAG: cytochrome c peroxidase [Lysobacterales bacterium]
MTISRLIRCAAALALCAAATAFAQVPLPPPPAPPENPTTAGKVALGKTLFWEEQLSLTGTVACGTCHRPQAGGSDPRTPLPGFDSTHPGANGLFGGEDDIRASAGVPLHGVDGLYRLSPFFGVTPQVGKRKSPTMINAAFAPEVFWDGRARSRFDDPISGATLIAQGGALENQALAPLLDTSEMGHVGNVISDVPARIESVTPLALAVNVPVDLAAWIGARNYPALFDEVFGTPSVTPARIAFAIASYQRVLNATQTRFDAELAGTPSLTPEERVGREVFVRLQCSVCHAEALHTDNSFRYIGVRPVTDDLGRFEQTGDPAHRGQMKVPSLRNVGLRAPYMHTGRLATLEQVVEFYLRGGDFNAPNKDPLIIFRSITGPERDGLLAYLRNALTDPRIAAEAPPFDRPRLYIESTRVPTLIGSGVAGGNGFVPVIAAREPPHANNRKFTVSVHKVANAGVGRVATLVVGHTDPGVQATVPIGDFANLSTTVTAGNFISNGFASLQLDLSQDPALVGQTLFGRFYIADPGAANGLAITQAFRFTVFGVNNSAADLILRDGFE